MYSIPVVNGNNVGNGSLRNSIAEANTYTGSLTPHVIILENVIEIILTSTDISISKPMLISYRGEGRVFIRRQATGGIHDHFNIFTIRKQSEFTDPIIMEDLDIGGTNTTSSGGAIVNRNNSTLNMINCVVISNRTAYYGGGIYNTENSTLNMESCEINSNIADLGGGGIRNLSGCTLNMNNCIIRNNTTIEGANPVGMGIYNSGLMTLTNCEIHNNYSDRHNTRGCGIYTDSPSNCLIDNCIIHNNRFIGENEETIFGVGIYVAEAGVITINECTIHRNTNFLGSGTGGGIDARGNVIIANSTFTDNDNRRGGGIFHGSGSTLSIVNSTIHNNMAHDEGGGIASESNNDGTVDIVNTTISGNTSENQGGGIYLSPTSSGSFTIYNTIVAGNSSGENPDFSGNPTQSSNNLIGNNEGSNFVNGVNNNIVGTPGSPINPMLKPIGDYGGPTLTMTLQPGSPAFDNGNTDYIPSGVEFDQRGPGYPRILDSTVNIGATEGTSVCYSGESLILVKNIDTNEIAEIKAKDVFSNKHLVFDTISKTFIPIKFNIVTGPIKRYMKITKDSLGDNKPNTDFYVTSGHQLVIDGKEIKASKISVAKKIKVKPEKIYSICTENRTTIQINNLDVMTWGYDEWMETCIKRGVNWIDNKQSE